MKPSEDILEHLDGNSMQTAGVGPVKTASTEKPVAKLDLNVLADTVEFLERYGWDTVYVWEIDGPLDNCRALAFTDVDDGTNPDRAAMALGRTGRDVNLRGFVDDD